MKVQEVRFYAEQLSSKKTARLGLGIAIQCTHIYQAFCWENKCPSRFENFTRLLHSSLKKKSLGDFEPEEFLYDTQEMNEYRLSYMAVNLAVYSYEQRVLGINTSKDIINIITNELFEISSYFSIGPTFSESIELPDKVNEQLQLHMPLLMGEYIDRDYFAHCSLTQFPILN